MLAPKYETVKSDRPNTYTNGRSRTPLWPFAWISGSCRGSKPAARVAVLYQNDDHGKEYLKGLKDGLGARAGSMIVAEVSYAPNDPAVDSQVVTLQASGDDVFMNFATAKAAAQASGWPE